MQFLLITKEDTMVSISRIIGQQNIDLLLAENNLIRMPKIGQQWKDKCDNLIATTPNLVDASRKAALLNTLVDSEEAFEKACLMDEDEWKVFSAFMAFTDALRIPESLELPYSYKIIGAKLGNVVAANIGNVKARDAGQQNVEPVDSNTYRVVMRELQLQGTISPGVFNAVNTAPSMKVDATASIEKAVPQYSYNLPWGKIQLYSTLLKEAIDFPAYPEPLSVTRTANYTAMPDIIYQYEPWIMYQSSGPREQSLQFHLHRDLWSGDHRDGQANKLIRFCEANTFPRYTGSAVLAPLVRLYVDGSLFISGVITNTSVDWDGPIGLDNWFLEFRLNLTIQEVSDVALNIDSVLKFGVKGS